jgi:hypothetical protein
VVLIGGQGVKPHRKARLQKAQRPAIKAGLLVAAEFAA